MALTLMCFGGGRLALDSLIFGDASLHQMAYYLPQTRDDFSRMSGVGKTKLVQLSDDFLGVIRSHTAEQRLMPRVMPVRRRENSRASRSSGATYWETKTLIEQGLSIGEVAERRGLAETTVVGHLEGLAAAGEELDLERLALPPDRVEAIRTAFQETGSPELAPVRAVLGDGYSYEEIRLARIFLEGRSGRSS